MGDVVRQILNVYQNNMDRLFMEMPIGSILCVHDGELEMEYETWRITSQVHYIAPGNTCKAEGRKTQYGPKEEHHAR